MCFPKDAAGGADPDARSCTPFVAPSRWAGRQGPPRKAAEGWTLLVFVSGPAVSASLAGPSASDAAGDSPMGTNWASPFGFRLRPLVPADEVGVSVALPEVLQAIGAMPPAPCAQLCLAACAPEISIPSAVRVRGVSPPHLLWPHVSSPLSGSPFPLKRLSLRARHLPNARLKQLNV